MHKDVNKSIVIPNLNSFSESSDGRDVVNVGLGSRVMNDGRKARV